MADLISLKLNEVFIYNYKNSCFAIIDLQSLFLGMEILNYFRGCPWALAIYSG